MSLSEGTLLVVLLGVFVVMGILMIITAANNLWTSLLLGSMLAGWYRQRCLTDDTGVPTGAYTFEQGPDGKRRRKPVAEQADDDLEAKQKAEWQLENQFFKEAYKL